MVPTLHFNSIPFYVCLLTFFSLLPPKSLLAQTSRLDSLELVVQENSDSVKLEAMLVLGKLLRGTNSERGIEMFKDCIAYAEKLGHVHYQILGWLRIGISYGMTDDYPNALAAFQSALDLQKSMNNLRGMASTNSNIGIVYKRIGDYPKSIDYYFKALELHDSLGNMEGIATIYSNLGVLYDVMEESDKALEYYEKAEMINKEYPDEDTKLSLLMNKSIIYQARGEYQKALEMQKIALGLAEEINAPVTQQNALNNLGYIYRQLKDFETAKSYLLRSLELGNKTKVLGVSARCFFNLSKIALQQNNFDEAIYYANEELKITDSVNSFSLKRDVHELFTDIYRNKGNYKKALEHRDLANQYMDSTYTEQKVRDINQMETRFKVYEKDHEIEQKKRALGLLKTQVRLERRWKFFLGLALLLVGLSSFLFYQSNQIRKKKNLALEEKNRMIETQKNEIQLINTELEKRMLRAQINPHFIFNSLSSIQHFITTNDKGAALKYLSKFSNLLRQVLENSISIQVPLAEEIKLLKIYLELESLRFDHSFQFNIKTDPNIDPHTTEIPILLIQPFVENALLHGLAPKKGDRNLDIYFKDEPDFTLCSIQDNGVGRAAARQLKQKRAHQRPSRGLEVTKKRLATLYQLKDPGDLLEIIDLKDEQGNATGTKVIIHIPKSLT